jgi:hypothetical protein
MRSSHLLKMLVLPQSPLGPGHLCRGICYAVASLRWNPENREWQCFFIHSTNNKKTRRLLFQLHEKLPFSHGGQTNIPAVSWGVSEMLTSSLFSGSTLNSKDLSTSCGLCKVIIQCNHCQVMLYDWWIGWLYYSVMNLHDAQPTWAYKTPYLLYPKKNDHTYTCTQVHTCLHTYSCSQMYWHHWIKKEIQHFLKNKMKFKLWIFSFILKNK